MTTEQSRRGPGLAMLALLGLLALSQAPVAADDAALHELVDRLRAGESITIGEAEIAAGPMLIQIYERLDHRLAWTDRDKVKELLDRVAGIASQGLSPEDYHLDDLLARLPDLGGIDTARRAELDLLLSESLIRLGYHLNFGKVDPHELDPNWNFRRDFDGVDPATVLVEAIRSDSLDRFIDERSVQHPIIDQLLEVLDEYQTIDSQGGWPQIPAGPTLKPGMRDERIGPLRQRLGVEADAENRFDAALEQAVVRFQRQHGLDDDGMVGPATLATLNRSAASWVDQIRVNIERSRWVLRHIDDDFIVTNVAGFQVMVIKDGQRVWSARAQVGKTYRKTPIFQAQLRHLVFNPTWTVPPGILTKDILPAVRRDPAYLEKKHLRVLERDGTQVDPTTLDWEQLGPGRFPYILRQDPGPWNALGRVKFIFPNEHFVFLHDTPSRDLFDRSKRTFSSGCIRVDRPLELAELLLDNADRWDLQAIRELVDSGETRTVLVPESLPVLLLYWTVQIEPDGQVLFWPDVYDRDSAILEALDGEFVFTIP